MVEFAISTGITLVVAVIGYFLKRTMNRSDTHDKEIMNHALDIKEQSVMLSEHKTQIDDLKDDVDLIRQNYTPKETHIKDFDECKIDIKRIKEDYITRDDFYRELNKVDKDLGKLDKKIDFITDILIQEVKGKGGMKNE